MSDTRLCVHCTAAMLLTLEGWYQCVNPACDQRLRNQGHGLPSVPRPAETEPRRWPEDHLDEAAWGLVANVGNGDWTTQPQEWQDAAARWRDAYHRTIAPVSEEREPETPLREALGGWDADAVDRQYEALYALLGDSEDATIRCAVANLRNANRKIRQAAAALLREDAAREPSDTALRLERLVDRLISAVRSRGEGNGMEYDITDAKEAVLRAAINHKGGA